VTETAWYAGTYPLRMMFRFRFENALIAYEDGKLAVYENNGKVSYPLEERAGVSKIGGAFLEGDGYIKEIRYFVDCIHRSRAPNRVKPEELMAVMDILSSLK